MSTSFNNNTFQNPDVLTLTLNRECVGVVERELASQAKVQIS